MKINALDRKVETSGLSNSRAGFKSTDITHIFNLLASSLYSNPIESLVRELSANAYDAQVVTNNTDKPFKIHCPNTLEPFFEVQDYGTGLSHDFMMDHYTNIGYSDKRSTNALIGGKGIGRLSAFSYTDSYTVESRHNNELRIYSVHVTEVGAPDIVQVGVTKFTAEPSGLTVKVPVKSLDIIHFEKAIKTALQYYEVKPVINKPDDFFPEIEKLLEDSQDGHRWFIAPDPEASWSSQASLTIVMGGVSYPATNILPLIKEKTDFSLYSNLKYVLFFDIGDIDTTPSREGVQLNNNNIDKTLSIFENMRKAVITGLEKQISDCDNYVNAIKKWRTLKKLREAFKLDKNNNLDVKYKGITIATSVNYVKIGYDNIDTSIAPALTAISHSYTMTGNTFEYSRLPKRADRGNFIGYDYAGDHGGVKLFITLQKDKRIPSRMKKYHEECALKNNTQHDPYYSFLVVDEETDIDPLRKALIKLGFPEKEIFVFKDEVPLYKTNVNNSSGTKRPSGSIYSITAESLETLYQMPRPININSNKYFLVDDQIDPNNTSGIYINVKSWQPEGDYSWEIMIESISYLLHIEYITKDTKIYVALKNSKYPFDAAPNWQSLQEYLCDYVKKTAKSINKHSYYKYTRRLAAKRRDDPSNVVSFLHILDTDTRFHPDNKSSKLFRYYKYFSAVVSEGDNTKEFRELMTFFRVVKILNKESDYEDIINDANDFTKSKFLNMYNEHYGKYMKGLTYLGWSACEGEKEAVKNILTALEKCATLTK